MNSSRKSFLWLLLIALLSLIFYYIIYNNFHNNNGEQIFFSNILNGFMGAIVVALVTASIFIVQNQIQAEDDKNKSIYEKKLNLYQKISQLLAKRLLAKNDIKEIDSNLREMYFEVFLIAGHETSKSFRSILEAEDINEKIDDFIHKARKDLDVLTNENFQKSDFFDESVTDIMKKRKFSDEEKKKIVIEYNKADDKKVVLEKYSLYYSQISDWKKKGF